MLIACTNEQVFTSKGLNLKGKCDFSGENVLFRCTKFGGAKLVEKA